MHWINIHTETLRGEEFLGAEPIERATWLSLLGWCCAQENKGVIESCSDWTDRKWQQICGVTLSEVNTKSDLYEFDGIDLVIHFYPLEHQEKAEASRVNGRKGGRPKKVAPSETLTQQGDKPIGSILDNPDHNLDETLIVRVKERKSNSNSNNHCEEIYSIYPRKVGKGVAIKSIEKALKKISFEDLKPIVERYAEKTTWKEKQYIPAPATWFNQDRWEDDQSEWEAPKPKSNFNTPSHHHASSVDPTKPTMS